MNVAENDPEQADVAYYLLARTIAESDPERAAEYTIKAANLGHGTSECLLSFGYAHERATGVSSMARFVPQLPKDFEKSRHWSNKCSNGPFAGYREQHFKKYEAAKNHKAYAKSANKHRTYLSQFASPEIAASVVGELCKLGAQIKEIEDECVIVSIDGEWVDYTRAPPLPERVGELEDLLMSNARTNFNGKFQTAPEPKVFAQGPLGNWASSANPNASLEAVTQLAIKNCQNNWRYEKYGSACEVVNVNGEWVK